MEVTRDVILDLLPLYLAGEASTDAQALVKEYLEKDPDLAKLAGQWRQRLPGPPPAPSHPDSQALAYMEAKRKIALKTALVGAGIAAGILALAAVIALSFLLSSAP